MQAGVSSSGILCAVDSSEPGRAAFQQALSLARAHSAPLSLVFAIPDSVECNWHAPERVRLMGELRDIAVAENVIVNISEHQGDPAEVVLFHARARKHDAIVIGTDGPGGAERRPFGSVADRVVAAASCPTFVVPATPGARVDDAFSHILCPVNVSPGSRIVVESAMNLLRRGGRKLTLLHVGPLQRVSAARIQLQQLAPANADLAGKIHARLAGGPVASGILDVAAELKPDLIVLGMTSRRGFQKWFNSITSRIVQGSTCPVLAIPGQACG